MDTASNPFLGSETASHDYRSARVVVIPAGFEKSVCYGRGTANGPAAIIQASEQLEFYDRVTLQRLLFLSRRSCRNRAG